MTGLPIFIDDLLLFDLFFFCHHCRYTVRVKFVAYIKFVAQVVIHLFIQDHPLVVKINYTVVSTKLTIVSPTCPLVIEYKQSRRWMENDQAL